MSPPKQPFVEEVFELAATTRIPWLWRGAETPQAFQEAFWGEAFVQFAIEDLRNGRPVGLIWAYDVNPFHGYAYVSMFLHPDFTRRIWPLEGTLLFANYLFTKLNLRNIYAHTAAPYFDQFRSGAGTAFDVEGRLRGRVIVNGKPEDLYILTFSRERWHEVGLPLLERYLPPVSARPDGLASAMQPSRRNTDPQSLRTGR